ncbi:molecular chaperone HtpG [Geitlerinema sp. PCC 9228]|jgi:molecular chaperone HtpG|uniref:molecular chaperone HtpG n=1 Tax=Geitlerinema sp. PCC 9228 TaxID=111611 RepID=UPI0008F9D994|nr:molecular chaperone HtpG [Geitlerinema sp. PCC 9228]
MTVLEQGNINIHTENIFPIIKKSLYSSHEIFLRELISNAVDAISKVKMVSYSEDVNGEVGDGEIQISIDKENNTLSVTDDGIGMTAEEVKKYINQVAFSSAEEFIQKYQAGSDQQIIGHFGLGFYSSFMVADRVEIDTLSYRPDAQAVHWVCDGSPAFTLEDSSRTQRGTTITLHLQEEEKEYLEPERIKQLVKKYCDFMPIAIKLDGEQINRQKALWRQSPKDLSNEDYLEFYRYLYPYQEEPLLWVHLNTDYPFLLNGILYFPKLRPDIDVTKSQIKLFCNQVYVSDRTEDIIPNFLLPMRGVIDSPDIPLNVSRTSLQTDRTVRRISDFIAKKVADRLKSLYRENRQKYIDCWQDIGTFVKFGCINDEKFKNQVQDIIIFKTTADLGSPEQPEVQVQSESGDAWQEANQSTSNTGDSYTTLQEYLDRNQDRHENQVFYCSDPVTQASFVELHKSQGLEVLYMDSFIDPHFISFLEKEYQDVKFSRVDAEIDDKLIDKDQDSEIVDASSQKTRNEQLKELFQNAINQPQLQIRTEAVKGEDPNSTPPVMILLPESMRRLRDMSAMMGQDISQLPDNHILLVNTSHPLIKNLAELSQSSIIQGGGSSPSKELANMLCQHLYDLALMSQKGVDAEGMKSFVERSNQVLTRLTEKANG